MYLGWKTNLFSKITTVAYKYTSCAYYICLHTHTQRENKCDKISDLGEQYMGFILVYGVLVLQLSCRFAFFQKRKVRKEADEEGDGGEEKEGLGDIWSPSRDSCVDAPVSTSCPQRPYPGLDDPIGC